MSPERGCGGSRRCSSRGRQHRSAEKAGRGGPTGVEEQGMSTLGFPRNLGDPVVSARYPARGGSREKQGPWPAVAALGHRRERSTSAKSGTAKRRQTKCGGMGGRESERPTV